MTVSRLILVTFGSVISTKGRVKILVVIGFSDQEENDMLIMVHAPMNPAITTLTQIILLIPEL